MPTKRTCVRCARVHMRMRASVHERVLSECCHCGRHGTRRMHAHVRLLVCACAAAGLGAVFVGFPSCH